MTAHADVPPQASTGKDPPHSQTLSSDPCNAHAVSPPLPEPLTSEYLPRTPSPHPARRPHRCSRSPISQSPSCNASQHPPYRDTADAEPCPPQSHSRSSYSANNDPSRSTNSSHQAADKFSSPPATYSSPHPEIPGPDV